jgi:hypothetical protein
MRACHDIRVIVSHPVPGTATRVVISDRGVRGRREPVIPAANEGSEKFVDGEAIVERASSNSASGPEL